ncbi:MAG TPA: hypothetical protein VKF15_04055 [Nitrososphaerales archaeon]|nr:hypothetical protein [Nitrososphaerales archaeon]
MLALNIAGYAIVAGIVAFGVYYAIMSATSPGDALAGSSYVGVLVALFVGAFSAAFAYRNSKK